MRARYAHVDGDGCLRNSTSASQILCRSATTRAPTLSGVPANATVECDAVPSPAARERHGRLRPRAARGLPRDVGARSCPQNRVLTRTWTATDACGNSTSSTQVISVRDTRAPSLLGVPADVTVECDAVPAPASVDCHRRLRPRAARGLRRAPPARRVPGHLRAGADLDRHRRLRQRVLARAARERARRDAAEHPGSAADATVECDAVPGAPR